MSKSELWGPHGCLVGKNKPFGNKNQLPSLERKTLNPSAQDLKCNGKSIFFDLVKYEPKQSKKNLNSNNIVLYEKIAFRFNGPQEVPQQENP